jgi:chaperonin GroEL
VDILRLRVLDAVAATKAALEEGIVAGGEVVYLNIMNVLGNSFGEKILSEAIQKPFDLLMSHANLNAGRMRLCLEMSQDPKEGVDVMDGMNKDMFKAGIIDPAKVSKEAIRNACSVAISIITTGCVIINIDDANKMPQLS